MQLRRNLDIEKIIIHHTGHGETLTGREVNNQFVKANSFGAPYDVLVNFDGTIDLTPRWTFGNTLIVDSPVSKIFKYQNHYHAGIGNKNYRLKGFHVACIGNFDIIEPSPYQFNTLIKILIEFACYFHFSLYTSLEYYEEIENTSSPGVLFFPKKYFLFTPSCSPSEVRRKKGYGDEPWGGDTTGGWGEFF
ncbi:MAG: N-acetylmuramoyl-L-alanine amidase [Bacilli bacterium]|nr:N-acetylmuramoyl-L-alanine amidase [Bacilli bacterium]